MNLLNITREEKFYLIIQDVDIYYLINNNYRFVFDVDFNEFFVETFKDATEIININLMNYPQAKDLCVSRFIDFSNENTSPCFCFKSVVQSLNQTIFYLINLVIVN